MKTTWVLGGVMAVALLLLAPAAARAKSAQRTARATPAVTAERPVKADKADAPADKSDGDTASTTTKSADGKTIKTKSYTFGAMDVEGKLKTPQLLYFLNRVKLELDMSAPDKRSFMKELARSSDDKSL
jgi:hypothetical protein